MNNKKQVWRIIIVFLIVATVFPVLLDCFVFGNSFKSNLDNESWAGFLGSYIGGIATIIVFFLTILYANEQNLECCCQAKL